MEELYRLIPDRYAAVIASRLNEESVCELRIRDGLPVRIGYGGGYYYLCGSGITKEAQSAFVAAAGEAEGIVLRACDHSLYTVTESIKAGYISVSGGIRLGVCGSAVVCGGTVTAVKDFTSVNIRMPHEVTGCAGKLFSSVISGGRVLNTLIISLPGGGKTTVLRDVCRLVSDCGYNVLLCDEKREIAACSDGKSRLDVGMCTDVVSGMDKQSVFRIGIAYMRPDVIIADELFSEDVESIRRASHCGISVIATVHARDMNDFFCKPEWKNMTDGVFDRYAVISPPPERKISVYDSAGRNIA